MQGFQLTFFTEQNRHHGQQPLAEWLLQLARRLGLHGATLLPATEGFGKSRRIHSAHFFDLADQPLEVVMIVTEDEAAKLFSALREEQVDLFYVKAPVEFGRVSDTPS